MAKTAKLLLIPHGIEWFSQLFQCSVCHIKWMVDGGHTPNFCPNCGLRLEPTPET
jgi:hypothetical protein